MPIVHINTAMSDRLGESGRRGPAEWVWGSAFLYGRQGIVELLGDSADFAIAVGGDLAAVLD